jgi:hypothetical protein
VDYSKERKNQMRLGDDSVIGKPLPQRAGRMTARQLWSVYLPDVLLGWKSRIFPGLGTALKNRDT